MNSTIDPKHPPSEQELLLPWYLTGTLSPEQQTQLEQQLQRDPELVRQLETARQEQQAAITANRQIAPPTEQALQRLMAAMGDAAPVSPRPASPLWHRLQDLFTLPLPRLAAVPASLLLLAQALLLGIWLWLQPAQQTLYHTASAPPDSEGTQLLIQFQPSARLMEIQQLLLSQRGEILAGPKPGGFYQVRFHGSLASAQLMQQLSAQRELVQLVLPAYTIPPR